MLVYEEVKETNSLSQSNLLCFHAGVTFRIIINSFIFHEAIKWFQCQRACCTLPNTHTEQRELCVVIRVQPPKSDGEPASDLTTVLSKRKRGRV